MEEDEVREAEDAPLRSLWAVVRSLGIFLKATVAINTINEVKRQMPSLEMFFSKQK